MTQRPIVIAGAGSIGCFVGGMLALAGRDVRLLARPRVIDEIKAHGLRLTDSDHGERRVAASDYRIGDDAQALLRDAAFVLVAVKSLDTRAMAEAIARHAPNDAIIVSLQNGVSNVAEMNAGCGGRRVIGAMVPFNVVSMGEGRFHRASSGDIQIARDEGASAERLSVPGLSFQPCDDIASVQWGKLLLNLNNALVALSGLTLGEELAQRAWRQLFAAQMSEALAAMRAANITPRAPTPIPARALPYLLKLPDALFQAVLGRSMKIDPQARSSMWEDLQRKRPTEIDYLQGVVVALAAKHGVSAPVNRKVMAAIKAAETAQRGPPGLRPDALAG